MTTKRSFEILQLIKKEHRVPMARWIFILRNIVIWALVVISVLAAGIFFGTLLADLIKAEWSLASRWPGHGLGFLRDTIAWLWVAGLAVAVVGGALFFRLTRRGYRYGVVLIATVLIATSIVTGGLLLPTPMPKHFQDWRDRSMPPRIEVSRFYAPDEGRLLGEVTSVDDDTIFVEGPDGKSWELWLFDGQRLSVGDFVEVFGERIDASTFAVMSIHPVPPHYPIPGLNGPNFDNR